MHRYQAYGLTIQSDLELPMLLPAKKYARAKVRLYRAEIAKNGLDSPQSSQLHFHASPGELWLRIPAVGLFLITGGNQIRYMPEPQTDQQTLTLFLLKTCLGALLQQREFIVLRAMAVKFEQQAVVFAGVSGEGKSLLAAALHKQGYQVITDDLCVIDGNNKVLPGYPMLKVWHDCLRVLEIEPKQLKRIRPQVEKYLYPIKRGFYDTPLPCHSIYLLDSWNRDEPEIKPITGMQKLMPLQSHTSRLQYLEGLGLMTDNMKRFMKLAAKVRLCRLTRPQNLKVAQWIELIETDINQAENASIDDKTRTAR